MNNEQIPTPPDVALSACQLQWSNGRVISLPPVHLARGESLGVMGPSGCGKSTWLRWLLGVKQPYVAVTGDIVVAGKSLTQQPIEQRGIGLVMQEQALFPHYDVADNLMFALAQQRIPRHAQRELIAEKLASIGLPDYQQRMPNQLSGGERARIALLRAVLAKPELILLDEPFNGLDQARRQQICQWTYQFLREQGVAAIVVSHDENDLALAHHRLQWPQAEYVQGNEALS
ncbi:ATP-binding cassette domain-containing protein [Pseudidiomarina sp.]|uniref:ATP-binding cassette domain-containing protein n=1 Tax=Pseudidiomarina sp. TaxID=2081707 RepID=UPI003A9885B9